MRRSLRYWATFALLGTAGAARLASHRIEEARLAAPFEGVGDWIAGWRSLGDEALGDRVLTRLAPTAYLARNYEKDGRRIGVFIAYYGRQRSGETLHSPKRCLPGAGWSIRETGTARAPLGRSGVAVNRYVVENAGRQAEVLYWYQSGGRVIANEYLGKLALLRDAVLEGRQSGSIVRLTFDRSAGAVEEGLAFAAALIPRVERCLTGGDSWTQSD